MSRLLLDSGAYTAWTKGTVIDIDQYIEFIKKHKDLFDTYINLDVIGDPKGSMENWRYMKKAGVDPMPVYHNGAPEALLEEYLDVVDYIGFGAIAQLDTTQRKLGLHRIWSKYLTDTDGNPVCKVHGLGLTSLPIMTGFPWYSVDSASCVKAAAYGKIYLPTMYADTEEKTYSALTLFTVSHQGNHDTHKQDSLFVRHRAKTVANLDMELITKNGFVLGDITGRVLTERRCRKGEVRNDDLGFNILGNVERENDTPTLANDYIARYKFNIRIWQELERIHGNVHIYQVCSAPKHVTILRDMSEEPKILISYLQLKSPAMMQVVRELKGEKE